MRPNLFILGFQKCGSSSLFDYLQQHPDIVGSNPKETFAISDESYEHYDNKYNIQNHEFNWKKYYDTSPDSKYILEGSVSNFYQQTAKEYIVKIPNAKVIFILRDPIERFVSVYNYFGGKGIHLKPNTSLEEFYKLIKNKQITSKEPLNFALEHGKYCTYIEEWKEILGKDNVLVVGMKHMIKEPACFSKTIFNFLDISEISRISLEHKNKSKVVRFQSINKTLVKLFGGKGIRGTFLMKLYKKLMETEPTKIIVPLSLKSELQQYYKEEYEEYLYLF